MKPNLLKAISIALLYGSIVIPQKTAAQCLCSGGTAPNALEYLVVLDTTVTSSTNISFPKFDPAVGTLSCVRLDDTISVVSRTGIRNLDPADTEYEFILTVTTNIAGPSLSITNAETTNYGPDLLSAFGNPGDSINYGPDTLYNNLPSTKTNTTNMVPYLGATGNVNFVYSIGGGTIAFGGANFNSQMRTATWGVFKLTYYWCENSVLASGIRNFKVESKDNLIELEWDGPENSSNNNFEIQISQDGKTFTNIGANTNAVKSTSTEYKYQYQPDQPLNKKHYFRVRYNDGTNIRYSQLKMLWPDNAFQKGITIYPNPVIKTVNFDLGEALSGDLQVELFNQAGQIVYQRKLWLNGNKTLQLQVNDPPPPGMYYLKARQAGSSKVYTGKLLFKR